ncbi:15680_t:CDS:2 [Funneliformis caledonium]|uniref:15680_t:CDS:1 n=1 Tax=Funneliformis caledonium TaxID=1117310 RepID=A0A9N9CFH0_9GLOM|nr:15680_t:CDS:2 [Funneliformis caledonium]
MYNALALPELLEIIFAFLSRKDLYRSCTRVNHQWNAVSKLIIQKKRKAEFISIPSIRDNIIFHLYDNCIDYRETFHEYINYFKTSWIELLRPDSF